METKQNYFIIFDTTEGAFLSYDADKNSLITFSTEKQARDAFELNYKEYHEQDSPTWGASAALQWINLRPFVIALPADLTPMEVLTRLTNSDTPDIKAYSLSSDVVRRLGGIKVDLTICRNYQVSKVELINPKWWQDEPA
jgi:hypothetical protein